MSPRAACRLEQFGLSEVYDYVLGKSDWLAAGLPREGQSTSIPYAGDLAVPDVPTCQLSDSLPEVVTRLRADQNDFCIVTEEHGLVLGILFPDGEEQTGTVAQAMREGPSTVRASEPVEPLLERMNRAGVSRIPVTDPEGRLLGMFSD